MEVQRIGLVGLLLFGLTGCASVDLRAGFPEVSAAVAERSTTKIVWNNGTDLDREAEEKLRALRQKKLTADDAVQIAMLSNRDLQAIYTELGVAQADLVQAGLFRNPILDAAVLFPLSGVRPDIQLSVVVGFLDVLYVPLRKRVAAALFEEVGTPLLGMVLNQDVGNFARTQRGLHQPGFTHLTVSPTEECRVVNLHRTLEEYLGIGPEDG